MFANGVPSITHPRKQRHLFRIILGEMPIANRCKYFNDGRVLERVHTNDKCMTIEARKDEVAATRHPHRADETLHI